MTGLQIIISAITDVRRNFYEALAVSGLLWISVMALQVVILGGIPADATAEDVMREHSGSLAFLNLVTFFVSVWIAVAWHRFILLGERPKGALPRVHLSQMLGYLWMTIQIMLVAGVVGMVVGLVGVLIVGPTSILILMVLVPVIYVFYRISPMLPTAALGQRLSMADAWKSTQSIQGPVFSAGLFATVGGFFITAIGAAMPGFLLGLLGSLITGWLVVIVGVSVVSTIYRLAVEGGDHGKS